jgi:flavin-binding protein dodecin
MAVARVTEISSTSPKNDQIAEYQVNLMVTFVLDD